MRPIQRLIHAGFATAAIASASVPVLAWTVWPHADFEWYAGAGRMPAAAMPVESPPASRPGWVWALAGRPATSAPPGTHRAGRTR